MVWIDYQIAYARPFRDFGISKNGVAQNSHLDREQHGKVEDNVDIKPGGTWDSRH